MAVASESCMRLLGSVWWSCLVDFLIDLMVSMVEAVVDAVDMDGFG